MATRTAQDFSTSQQPTSPKKATKFVTPLRVLCVLVFLIAVAAGLSLIFFMRPEPIGGCEQKIPNSDPKYLNLAHFAVSMQKGNRKMYDTVVSLTSVCMRIVAGLAYELEFTTAPSNCTVEKDTYSAKNCVQDGQVNGQCEATVLEIPWKNTTEVVTYTCSTSG